MCLRRRRSGRNSKKQATRLHRKCRRPRLRCKKSLLRTPILPSTIFAKMRKSSKMTFGKSSKNRFCSSNLEIQSKKVFLFQINTEPHLLGRCETQHCDTSGLPDRSLLITTHFPPEHHLNMHVYLRRTEDHVPLVRL